MPHTPVYDGPSIPYTYSTIPAQAIEQPLNEALQSRNANHELEDDLHDHDDGMRELFEE